MSNKSTLSHFDSGGDAHMVDVGNKSITARSATAEGSIRMQASTFNLVVEGGHKKGDVLGIARIAGIMAAKRTSELIPLCHPLMLTRVALTFIPVPDDSHITCQVTAETRERTGVEMEALTAVQIALLTIYDMCKAADRGMRIDHVRLIEKSGGKSGHWRREDEPG